MNLLLIELYKPNLNHKTDGHPEAFKRNFKFEHYNIPNKNTTSLKMAAAPQLCNKQFGKKYF